MERRDGFVQVRGAREHNLKNINLDIPRDALVVFTGISGSGKSSLAFGTLYAEAQRRYLESVSPYARRLFHQMSVPEVDFIGGLPPAVALQQQRGMPTTRSSVGSVTTLSNLLRMLYSRAGDYPPHQPLLYAESFSPNTPEGACPNCHGLGRVYEVTERSMVPDDTRTIRERAIAAWPTAWHGQNLRDILITLGYDVDRPWRELSQKDRNWMLFTEDQPVVPVYPGFTHKEVRQAIRRKEPPSYMGTFTSARHHVLHSFSNTQSQLMKRRALQYMLQSVCPLCGGKRLRKESLSVTFAGKDITDLSRLPLTRLQEILRLNAGSAARDEKAIVVERITRDLISRLNVFLDLGLGYLDLERSTPTLSPGELQRLRLGTQVYSNLFGVVYVLDEPSAGLHPADTEALMAALGELKKAGNSLFVVEHDLDIIRKADWLVDVGPGAGEQGGHILYSGPLAGLAGVKESQTGRYLFGSGADEIVQRQRRRAAGWLTLTDIECNNLHGLEVSFPLGVLTAVTGISGSGKSSLVSQVLVQIVGDALGRQSTARVETDELELQIPSPVQGKIKSGLRDLRRLIQVDQKSIGRTPRSNLATYTGLFDHVRQLFATTKMAKARHFTAGRFSFNVAQGRCPVCEGEGFVMVELLFLPSVYAPCPKCHGTRYNEKTLEVRYKGKNIADVLAMTVSVAYQFFEEQATIARSLKALLEVGCGYLRLGQAATELSGGEAQRIKLATELQRPQRGDTVYVLDEPTTGLHPSDVERLVIQLDGLVSSGNTVVLVEHDMQVVSAADWIIDIGPGAGESGGKIVFTGTPEDLCSSSESRTAPYLSINPR